MKTPTWIWPHDVKAAPTGVARLGRVFHWTLAAFAVAFFAFGVVSTLESVYNHLTSSVAEREWDSTLASSAPDPTSPNKHLYRLEIDDTTYTIRGPAGLTQGALVQRLIKGGEAGPYGHIQLRKQDRTATARPRSSEVGWDEFWGFLAAAASAALIGRALRYILAAE